MNDDRLAQLLREADASQAPPALPSMAGQAPRRARQRLAVRTATAVLLLLALAGSWIAYTARNLGPQQRHEAIAQTVSPEQLRREIARLDAEADLHEQIAARMIDVDRATQQRRRLTRLAAADPIAAADRQLNRAALIAVELADRLYSQHGRAVEVAEDYRRVVALFPETYGAQLARQRLAQIEQQKEG